MNVVGREHVGVDRASVLRCHLLQGIQVASVMRLGVEASRAIATALDDVPRLPRYHNSGKTGRDAVLM